ncbi:hypothetical protein K1719_011218 [Acacia pycnantha]|nr:hypothetical protein K1719_011218 [Acacia pycnantha]
MFVGWRINACHQRSRVFEPGPFGGMFRSPVIGFVIHRNGNLPWQGGGDQEASILAAEEASRAETKASYAYATFYDPKVNQCAVCYSPTTTRCSRCKAVRYCLIDSSFHSRPITMCLISMVC